MKLALPTAPCERGDGHHYCEEAVTMKEEEGRGRKRERGRGEGEGKERGRRREFNAGNEVLCA